MTNKISTFKIVDAAYYKIFLNFKDKNGVTKTYPTYNLQLLFGRVNKGGMVWTPVITFIMTAKQGGQLQKFLSALYVWTPVNKILKSLDKAFKDNNDRDRTYEMVYNIIKRDIKQNGYHVELLIRKELLQGGEINQIGSIRKSRYSNYKDVKFSWPEGFSPGQPPAQKSDLDTSLLDAPIEVDHTEYESHKLEQAQQRALDYDEEPSAEYVETEQEIE